MDTDGDKVNRAVGGISLATALSPAQPSAFLRDPLPWGSRGRRQGVLPADGAGALAQFWHRSRGQFVSSGTPAPDRER